MVTLYVPAIDRPHAEDLIHIYQTVSDEVAIIMLNEGVIGRTREDADRFITTLIETNTPGAEDAQVFEFEFAV